MSIAQTQGLLPGCAAPPKDSPYLFHFVYDHHLDRQGFLAKYSAEPHLPDSQLKCVGYGAMNGGWRFHLNQLGQANLRKAYFTGNVDPSANCLVPAPFTEIPDYDSQTGTGVYGYVYRVTPEVDQAIAKSYGGTRTRQSGSVLVPRAAGLGGLTMKPVKCVFFVDLRNTMDNTTDLSVYARQEFGKWMVGLRENKKGAIPKWYLHDLSKMLYGNPVNPEPIYITSKYNGSFANMGKEIQRMEEAEKERSCSRQEPQVRQDATIDPRMLQDMGKGKEKADTLTQPPVINKPRSEAYAARLIADNERQRQKIRDKAARAEIEKAEQEKAEKRKAEKEKAAREKAARDKSKKRRVDPENADPPRKRVRIAEVPATTVSRKPAMRMNAEVASTTQIGQPNARSRPHGHIFTVGQSSTHSQSHTSNSQRSATQPQVASQTSNAQRTGSHGGSIQQANSSRVGQSHERPIPQTNHGQASQFSTRPQGQQEPRSSQADHPHAHPHRESQAGSDQRVNTISSKGFITVPKGITSINELTEDEREQLVKHLREQSGNVFALWQRQKAAAPERTYPDGFQPQKCSIPWCIEIHVDGGMSNHMFKHPSEPHWMEEIARLNMKMLSKKRTNGEPNARPPKKPRTERSSNHVAASEDSLMFSSPVGFGNDSVAQESPAIQAQAPRPASTMPPSFLEAPGLQAHLGLKPSGRKSPERSHRALSPDRYEDFTAFTESTNRMISNLNRTPPNTAHPRKIVQADRASVVPCKTTSSPLKVASSPRKLSIDRPAAKALPNLRIPETQFDTNNNEHISGPAKHSIDRAAANTLPDLQIPPSQLHTTKTQSISGPRKLSIDRPAAKDLQKLLIPKYEPSAEDIRQSIQKQKGNDYSVSTPRNIPVVAQDGHKEPSLSPKDVVEVGNMAKDKPVPSSLQESGHGVSPDHQYTNAVINQQDVVNRQDGLVPESIATELENPRGGQLEQDPWVPNASEIHPDREQNIQKGADVQSILPPLPNPQKFAKSFGAVSDGLHETQSAAGVFEKQTDKHVTQNPDPRKFAKSFGEVNDRLQDNRGAAVAYERRPVVGFQMTGNQTPDVQAAQNPTKVEQNPGRAPSTLKSTFRAPPPPVAQPAPVVSQVGGAYASDTTAPFYPRQAGHFVGEVSSGLHSSQWAQVGPEGYLSGVPTNGYANPNSPTPPNHRRGGQNAAQMLNGPAPNYAAPTAASRERGQANMRRSDTPYSDYSSNPRQHDHNRGHSSNTPRNYTSPHTNRVGNPLNLELPPKPPTSAERAQPWRHHPREAGTSYRQNQSTSGSSGSPPTQHNQYSASQGFNGPPIPPPAFGPQAPWQTDRARKLSLSTTPHLSPPNRNAYSDAGPASGGRRPSVTQLNAQQFARGGKVGGGQTHQGYKDKKSLSKIGGGRG